MTRLGKEKTSKSKGRVLRCEIRLGSLLALGFGEVPTRKALQ